MDDVPIIFKIILRDPNEVWLKTQTVCFNCASDETKAIFGRQHIVAVATYSEAPLKCEKCGEPLNEKHMAVKAECRDCGAVKEITHEKGCKQNS